MPFWSSPVSMSAFFVTPTSPESQESCHTPPSRVWEVWVSSLYRETGGTVASALYEAP